MEGSLFSIMKHNHLRATHIVIGRAVQIGHGVAMSQYMTSALFCTNKSCGVVETVKTPSKTENNYSKMVQVASAVQTDDNHSTLNRTKSDIQHRSCKKLQSETEGKSVHRFPPILFRRECDSFSFMYQSRRKIVDLMLHKTYVNLKKKKLLRYKTPEEIRSVKAAKGLTTDQNNFDTNRECSMECTPVYSALLDWYDPAVSESYTDKETCTSSPLTVKEHFNLKMNEKYQDPGTSKAEHLATNFPDAENLFYKLVNPVAEANPSCAPQLSIKSHLQGRYWKAHLFSPWPYSIKVTGMHQDKDMAVKSAYLQICEIMQHFGLLARENDGNWSPMTCDKVVTMLETLSQYGDSSLGCSKGRGFKVVLEQIKDKEYSDSETDKAQQIAEKGTVKTFKSEKATKVYESSAYSQSILKFEEQVSATDSFNSDNSQIRSTNAFTVPADKDLCKSNDFQAADHSSFGPNGPKIDKDACSGMDSADIIGGMKDGSRQENVKKKTLKPNWRCTVHVGWPVPFKVCAEGLSLPSTQMMGYLAVAHKLKIYKLLSPCNNFVSSHALDKIMHHHTVKHFLKSVEKSCDRDAVAKFDAEAEIFSDASHKGFGAFLLLKDSEKVSWMSEAWKDHEKNKNFYSVHNGKFLESMFAELFALVTAVFSWKHKLRGRRLMCYGDNMIVLSIINSFNADAIEHDSCISSIDYLVHILQDTCLNYSIDMQATWLDREQNQLADCLSRNDIHSFRAAVSNAAVNRSKAKKLLIKKRMCNR